MKLIWKNRSKDGDIWLNPDMDHDNYNLYEELAKPMKKFF
jgi:hypothetical protein